MNVSKILPIRLLENQLFGYLRLFCNVAESYQIINLLQSFKFQQQVWSIKNKVFNEPD